MKEEYQRLAKQEERTPEQMRASKPHRNNGGVVIENMDNCLVKFARCCNPVPGDEIIGFITRGFGVSVHTRDCVNVPQDIEHSAEPERWVSVEWEDSVRAEFKASLQITATDRQGLLMDVTSQLSSMHVSIHDFFAREPKGGIAILSFTVGVNTVDHLQMVIARLSKIAGVQQVERHSHS